MYDFDAGDISLDFANTNNWHASDHPIEYLKSYTDLVTWALNAGLLTLDQAGHLTLFADQHPEDAAITYEHAIEVREAIYRIFSNHYANKPIREADLDLLNNVACQAMAHLQLKPMGNSFTWQLPPADGSTETIVWPIARAAAELLTSERAARVRECEDNRGCGYLFIDQTKNHSRRWCSMESCGNRAKARRHYSRVQAN